MSLTQDEANALMETEKQRVDNKEWFFPPVGDRIAIPLISRDKRENFMVDATRSQINLFEATYQNRVRQAIILMRLDLGGPPHRNPDGEDIPCPHIHIYREGYGDKWAKPAPLDRYTNVRDLLSTFEAFMRHCNITDPPNVQRGLFS